MCCGMRESVCPPQYLQIALDIAARIARGELKEGTKIYGRSVMSSEYGVSPETIRRSLRLLADMQVVEIKLKSGAFILSAPNARRYIDRFGESSSIHALQTQLKEVVEEHAALGRKVIEIASAIGKIDDKFSAATPFRNYEVQVQADSPVIGKSIGELCFWQATGATIIAIRRNETGIILSPGPYAQLLAGDIVVLIGDASAADAADALINRS